MNRRPLSIQSLLALDGATCAVMGAALLMGPTPIAGATGIPASLLFWAGASLMPIAAFMAISSRAAAVPAWAAFVVIAGNLSWIIASIVLPLTGLIAPNVFGWAFLLGQAIIVAVLTKLEYGALADSTTGSDMTAGAGR